MANPKASSVAPLTPIASPGSIASNLEQTSEQTRDFHFAVTWVTLFAHLDLVEAGSPRPPATNPTPTLALVPFAAPPTLVDQRVDQGSKAGCENAGWEMVVPKMVRNESGNFSPAESRPPRLL